MSARVPPASTGPPPTVMRGALKTFTRYNLITGTMVSFVLRLAPFALIPVAFYVFLNIDRNHWYLRILDIQSYHNREVARVKYSQDETLEEQGLAYVLNKQLPRPLNLTDVRPLTDNSTTKTRNQRIIAENISYASQLFDIPPVGVYSVKYKTFNKRIQEVQGLEKEFASIAQTKKEKNIATNESARAFESIMDSTNDRVYSSKEVSSYKNRITRDLTPTPHQNIFVKGFRNVCRILAPKTLG